MPVAVPICKESLSHRVVKPHTNACQSFTPETSKYVTQSACQPVVPQVGFSHHLRSQKAPSSQAFVEPFYSGGATARAQLACENSDLGYGLIAAGDAVISKQVHAEACHSPVLSFPSHPQLSGSQPFTEQRAMDDPRIIWELGRTGSVSKLCAQTPTGSSIFGTPGGEMFWYRDPNKPPVSDVEGELCCDTLLQPAATPFADFVDRVIAIEIGRTEDWSAEATSVSRHPNGTPGCELQSAPGEPLSSRSYIRTYRALAGPLSEWMADYVWKVCTDGVGLPRRFVGIGPSRNYEKKPSPSLSKSIHSILCSTLLQPSAIILALWYITRLPVLFEGQSFGVNLTHSEFEFRKELYGEGLVLSAAGERDRLEAFTTFRIALLGCMLANKWLDDHTFSNRTWQNISDVPIQSINRLELAALAVLGHDLSVTPKAWGMWLAQLQRFPLPICRPSANDAYAIARKMIMDLTHLHNQVGMDGWPSNLVQPVFSALLEFDAAEKAGHHQDPIFDPFEIDLDEDGPLREEYVPKRRPSALKGDAHRRSTSAGRWEWAAPADCSMCCSADANSASSTMPRNMMFGSSLSYSHPRLTPWDVNGSLGYEEAATVILSQPDIRSNQLNNDFPSSHAYPIPAICPPFTHSMVSSACAASSSQPVGHMRSLSQSFAGANDVCSFPFASCARYVGGHASNLLSNQGDVCHFRPLWLKT